MNKLLQKLEKQGSQAYNDTQSDASKDDENEQEDIQSEYYLNDKSRIKGLNNSQMDKSNIGDKPRTQERLDARKIRELQIKLNIIPREKNIYVNNTKLSFKRQSEGNSMNLFTKNNNLRLNIPKSNNSANASYNSMNNFSERQKGLFMQNQFDNNNNGSQIHSFQQKQDLIKGTSIRDVYRKQTQTKQDTLHSQDYENDGMLIEKIFTSNTKYSSMYSHNKHNGNIFLTQLSNNNNRNSLSSSQLLQDKNILSKKQSITSLNFNPSDIPSFRKFPQMLNTVYSYKLPTLSESISKDNILKFMNP